MIFKKKNVLSITSAFYVTFQWLFAGETDWKIIAIDVSDPLASKLNGENLQLSVCVKEAQKAISHSRQI